MCRYTECRLQALSSAVFLADLAFDTVQFAPTFDGSLEEPSVLPARIPHLLVNGTSGIAVGIATRIPPHNLREVVLGLKALIKNPDISLAGLMKHIPAPDFPTGVCLGASACVCACLHTRPCEHAGVHKPLRLRTCVGRLTVLHLQASLHSRRRHVCARLSGCC